MDIAEYGLRPQLPEVFDSTMLKAYQACPSKFYLRHCLGLRPRHAEDHPSLLWGSMWHKVMEIFHDDQDPAAAANYIFDNWPPELNETDRFLRTRERMAALFGQYIQKFGSQDMRSWRTIRREQYFEIDCPADDADCPYGGCGLHYCGRLDRLAEYLPTSSIYNWDYKTTAWFRSNTFMIFKHDPQMRGYYWAAQHLMRGQKITGMFIDLAHVTKTKEELLRDEKRWTKEQIVEWRDNTKTLVTSIESDFLAYGDSPESWIKHWQHCEDYGGCTFRDVHYTPAIRDVRLKILQEDYVEHRWHPDSEA